MKHVVFAPLGNTYAHIAECLAVAESLDPARYRITFLCAAARRAFVTARGYETCVTRELWEGVGEQRVMRWFDDAERFAAVCRDEGRALARIRPDLVVGSNRHTTALNCRELGIPYFSIMSACLHPAFEGYLGVPDELVDETARAFLARRYAESAAGLDRVLDGRLGEAAADVRRLLPGDRTFFSNLEAFEPLGDSVGQSEFVGTIRWPGWSERPRVRWSDDRTRRRLLLFMGSVISSPRAARSVLGLLERDDAEIVVIGAPDAGALPRDARSFESVDLADAVARSDLVLTHGGINVLHHCLESGRPCIVVPAQPEQAQNALRAARIGFARYPGENDLRRELAGLGPSQIARRMSAILEHYERMESGEIDVTSLAATLDAALEDPTWNARCERIGEDWRPRFAEARGAEAVADAVHASL